MLTLIRYPNNKNPNRSPKSDVYLHLPDGRTITVRVVENHSGEVRLAFDAPPDVRIERADLYEDRDAEQPKQSGASQP